MSIKNFPVAVMCFKGQSRSSTKSPFDRSHIASYYNFIVTVSLMPGGSRCGALSRHVSVDLLAKHTCRRYDTSVIDPIFISTRSTTGTSILIKMRTAWNEVYFASTSGRIYPHLMFIVQNVPPPQTAGSIKCSSMTDRQTYTSPQRIQRIGVPCLHAMLSCNAMLVRYMLTSYVCPSVCVFVTSRHCTKTAERRITNNAIR